MVFDGESFRETLLTSSVVVKWDGLAFGAFSCCVTRCFTLYVTFSADQACESDEVPRVFQDLGIYETTKDSSGASSKKNGEKKEHLEEPLSWDRLRSAL